MVRHLTFTITGDYGDGANDLLSNDMNTYFRWPFMASVLVRYQATHKTPATTTQPKINVKCGGNLVGTQDSSNGIQLDGTGGVWVACTAREVDYTNGIISYGEDFEIACTVAGVGGTMAQNLTVMCTFVEM
jgi:hypothetical protein